MRIWPTRKKPKPTMTSPGCPVLLPVVSNKSAPTMTPKIGTWRRCILQRVQINSTVAPSCAGWNGMEPTTAVHMMRCSQSFTTCGPKIMSYGIADSVVWILQWNKPLCISERLQMAVYHLKMQGMTYVAQCMHKMRECFHTVVEEPVWYYLWMLYLQIHGNAGWSALHAI